MVVIRIEGSLVWKGRDTQCIRFESANQQGKLRDGVVTQFPSIILYKVEDHG